MESASPPPRQTAPGADSGSAPIAGDGFPDRYVIRDRDGVRVLTCREAPGVAVRIERDFAFTEAEARRLGERTILLDGAGAFGPLVDDNAHLYNLDHHQDCVRAFTLATCEQALILVLKGLELDKGEWTIYANEPDLDSLFALWTLLNYRRIRSLTPEARDRIVPLIRLEGAIDANGFELAAFCGLPGEELERRRGQLDRLHQLELAARRSGEFSSVDGQEFCRRLLHEVDRLAYTPADLEGAAPVEEEYGHVDIGQGRVAVVCRDAAGIYEVEQRLKKIWGDRLGIIALEKEPGHFTLRRSAALAGIDLKIAYERLNLLDPAVDGRPPGKRWGGSDEIGGSPRRQGTGLSPREIVKILKVAYQKPAPGQAWRQGLRAAGWSLFAGLLATGVVLLQRFVGLGPDDRAAGVAFSALLAGLTLAATALVLTRRESRGWTWLHGWRRPAGISWWPLALGLGALAATGAWHPPVGPGRLPLLLALLAIAALAAGLELLFRGLVHGMLVIEAAIQRPLGPTFLSHPTLLAALLSSGLGLVAEWQIDALPRFGLGVFDPAAAWLLLFAAGALAGLLREKSLSVWPAALAFMLGSQARLAFDLL